MRYFLDTEFIEGFHKPLYDRNRHFIDLISIALKCEDGREYYAVSNEFQESLADSWVKNHVIARLPTEQELPRKSNKDIAREIIGFCQGTKPEFFAYYGDYDWVLFCSLFGRMIDLPEGFPMYCKDLKQTLDEIALKVVDHFGTTYIENPKTDLEQGLEILKSLSDFPKQDEKHEHDALFDARWEFELYKFLERHK